MLRASRASRTSSRAVRSRVDGRVLARCRVREVRGSNGSVRAARSLRDSNGSSSVRVVVRRLRGRSGSRVPRRLRDSHRDREDHSLRDNLSGREIRNRRPSLAVVIPLRRDRPAIMMAVARNGAKVAGIEAEKSPSALPGEIFLPPNENHCRQIEGRSFCSSPQFMRYQRPGL